MAKRKGNGHGLRLYASYSFRTKDPVIDELRTITEDHLGHRVTRKDLHEIELKGGPTTSCMTAWYFGITKRPTSAALEAAGRAIGFQRKWVKM
jgi:hypothetical protein